MNEEKKKLGRPKKKIDYEMVERMAHIFCTQDEIAVLLDVDVKTLQRDPLFGIAYTKGRQGGKMSLRRMQYKLAEKNTAMAVWLGKQYLGQRDLVNDENAPRISIVSDVPKDDSDDVSSSALTLKNDDNIIIDVDIDKTAEALGIDMETLNDK